MLEFFLVDYNENKLFVMRYRCWTDNKYSFGDLLAVLQRVYSVICPWWCKEGTRCDEAVQIITVWDLLSRFDNKSCNDRQVTACPRSLHPCSRKGYKYTTPQFRFLLINYFSAFCLHHVLLFRLHRPGSQSLSNVQGLSPSKV